MAERREDVCTGVSGPTPPIVYGGYDTHPGTLKTRLTVASNRQFDQLCSELGVRFRRCGSLMVAFGPRGVRSLERKLEQGRENGVEGAAHPEPGGDAEAGTRPLPHGGEVPVVPRRGHGGPLGAVSGGGGKCGGQRRGVSAEYRGDRRGGGRTARGGERTGTRAVGRWSTAPGCRPTGWPSCSTVPPSASCPPRGTTLCWTPRWASWCAM